MAFTRKFGTLRPRINSGSIHQTTASLLIDLHYENLQLINRWNWVRFARLCNFMQLTPYELGSLVLMRHDVVDQYRNQGTTYLIHGSRATVLLLTLIEAYMMKGWTDDIVENPLPSLAGLPSGLAELSPDALPKDTG